MEKDIAPHLGIVEGYFGTPWSWEDRAHVMRTLAPHGYRQFIYAPKADNKLRRDWRETHGEDIASAIAGFSAACRTEGVSFGIGLSPFELHLDWSAAGRRALADRVQTLGALGVDRLAILFDDMRGDLPDLAAIQADIVAEAARHTDAALTVCPSYYSDDPVLDRVFGLRPPGYLEALGEALPEDIDIFWTGPEVCSRDYSAGHIERVTKALGRKPVLWDNYPVNDGPRMSRHLHLRGFTGRGELAGKLSAHLINPALQPHLTLLPALTLARAYAEGADYDYLAATRAGAHALHPPELADALVRRSPDPGGRRMGNASTAVPLRARYKAMDHPAAAEVVRFLEGAYTTEAKEVATQ